MTIKLTGTTGTMTPGQSERLVDVDDLEKRIDAIWVSLCALIDRVEKIEAVNAVAHELPEKPAKKVKS
jgi:hypothetical protein